jgi:hypothetical protein
MAGPTPEVYDANMFSEAKTHPMIFSVTGQSGMVHRVPKTYAEAMKSPQAQYWKGACNEELDAIDIHQVKTLVPRPRDKRVFQQYGCLPQSSMGKELL